MPKPLYFATSLSQLNEKTIVNNLKSVKNPRKLCQTASKVYLQAKEAEIGGDEEMAYIFMMRYIGIVQAIKKHATYQDNKVEFDKLMCVKNIPEALSKAEQLSESLSHRYKHGDKPEDDIAVKPDAKKDTVKEESLDTLESPFINAVELYELLQKSPNQVIVLDCRTKSGWDSCHIDTRKFPQWFSVPEEAVVRGLTVHLIPKLLMAKSKKIWEERNQRSCIIVDLASCTSDVSTVALTLKDVIHKYDTTHQSAKEPRILEGGFQQWHLSFGPLCIGILKEIAAPPKKKVQSSTVSDSFQYPDVPDVEVMETRESQETNVHLSQNTTSNPVSHTATAPTSHSESQDNDDVLLRKDESSVAMHGRNPWLTNGVVHPVDPPHSVLPNVPPLNAPVHNQYMDVSNYHQGPVTSLPNVPHSIPNASVLPGSVNPGMINPRPTFPGPMNTGPPVFQTIQQPPHHQSPSTSIAPVWYPPPPGASINNGYQPFPQVQQSADITTLANMGFPQMEPQGSTSSMQTVRVPEGIVGSQHVTVAPQQMYARPPSVSTSQPVMTQGLAPEFDYLDQQVQHGMEEKDNTNDEIEKAKEQFRQLKILMEQKRIEEQKKQQSKLNVQKRKAEQSKFMALEDRLAMLEKENALFRDQQNQFVMHTVWAMNEALQAKTQEISQETIYSAQESPLIVSNVQDNTQSSHQQPYTAVESKTDDETSRSRESPVNSTHGQATSDVTDMKNNAAQEELDETVEKKMKELEEKVRALQLKEELMKKQQETQEIQLRERAAAMAEKEVSWERKKAEEEMNLKEQRASFEEEKKKFAEKQEEVDRQQIEYKKKEEELFAMVKLMNQSQGAHAPKVQYTGGNLPDGWEKRLDQRTGRFYYIDHNSKTTHWNPPTNWLRYGKGAQPPTSLGQQGIPQPIQPQTSMPNAPQAALSQPPVQPNQGLPMKMSEKTPGPAQPSVDRSKKPSSMPSEPQVNRALKPIPLELVKQKTLNLQPVMGTWGARGLTGLRNLGNTCFMNSTLQCLFNTVPLMKYCATDQYRLDVNRSNPYNQSGAVAEEFSWLMKAVWSGQYKSVSPRDFKTTIVKCANRFHGTEQQDSQELLAFLLDGLHEDLNKAQQANYKANVDDRGKSDAEKAKLQWMIHKKANDSIIVDMFQGQFRSTVRCLTCQYKSVVFEAFMYLPVPIPTRSASCTLKDCINAFTKAEQMSGDNKWDCPHCKCKRDVEKIIEIWKLPPVLIVILKRFWWDSNWTKHKITNYVDFPIDSLDMTGHVVGPPPKPYRLYATSNHTGRLDGGHYVAYCKNVTTGRFHCFDDEQVKDVATNSIRNSSTYFLFYTSLDFMQSKR